MNGVPDQEAQGALHEISSPEARLPVLTIQGLKKRYGLKPILRGIDLTLYTGERVALLGANGAGKTTLLRILAGLTKPSEGRIVLEGWDGERDAMQVRRLVGFVAHQPYLYEELTALENLRFFGKMYGVTDECELASSLLQKVGLQRRAKERVGTFSRGQLQRMAWARALLHAPRLLLLDEPDTGLDQEGNELITALWQEHTRQGGYSLFTTHQLEHALHRGERIVLLNGGRVVYQQETHALELDELRGAYRKAGVR